ncbi:MAG TPA: ABC transporter permease [Candidatus Limnocylindria bacterium]|nr:ABC transporter permease [Candidatus Limnocylindria bacterium]
MAITPTQAPQIDTAAPKLRPRGAGRMAYLEPTLLPLASFVILIVAWETAARLNLINPFFFSSPTAIVASGAENIATPEFLNDTWVSGQEFIVGYLWGVGLAIPFGLLTGWYRPLHFMFEPWLAAFNATPRLALLPLVVLWVGLGFWSKAVIVFLGVFFPVAINTFLGVRTVDRNLYDVSLSFGASGYRRIVSVVLPSVAPFALVGMKLGIGRAVSGVVVAEFFTSEDGLGNFVFRAGAQLDTAKLLFGAFFITALALGAFAAVSAIERRVKKWQPRVGSA